MKKSEANNKKLTDYFQLKGITHLGRALNADHIGNITPPYLAKTQGNGKQISDQGMIQKELWEQGGLAQYRNPEESQDRVCKQLIMIGPLDTNYYQSTLNKLRLLQADYSKQGFLKFVLLNAKFHDINNLTILQQMDDQVFWSQTAPKMLRYALARDKQLSISSKIPTLPAGISRIVEVTRAQVLMILINMFLCTLPWQSCRLYLSFSSLMSIKEKDRTSVIKMKAEKLKCFINYFKIAMDVDQSILAKQTLAFQRVQKNYKQYEINSNTSSLSEVSIKRGKIEDQYQRSIMVDFANKNIGGGVLSNGSVQEEILFCVFPELVSLMCLCEQIGQNQALIIAHPRKINRYSGYSEDLKFEGTYEERPPKQNYQSIIIAIDAIDFSQKICKGQTQYTSANIHREIVKALVGIEGAELLATSDMPVCTGRWGCGAFQGDPYLKFIIQWLACSIAKRKMVYMAQSEEEEHELKVMGKYLKKHDVSEVIESITQFNSMRRNKKITFMSFLKQFIA